jgi:putative ABC transport system substrate-binding protein
MTFVYALRDGVEAGGVTSQGPSLDGVGSHAADEANRIARGAERAGGPVEPPAKFELVVNSKSARPLGLDIPPTLLARADDVIA